MLRKLYHGSRDIIKKPVYGYGKKYNDYGLGFLLHRGYQYGEGMGSNVQPEWLRQLL